MTENADFFESKAIAVQEAAAEDDRDLALKSVDCQLYLFWGSSLLDLAVKSASHRFVETKSCTQAIQYRLYGDLSPYDSETMFGLFRIIAAVLSGGLLAAFSGVLAFTPPPMSEGFRRITQRRRIPKGYPHAPSENPTLKRLRNMVQASEKYHINISHRGFIFVDKKLKKLLQMDDSSASELSAVDMELLWSPTFSVWERLKCFLMAPKVLFLVNGIITIIMTLWISVWFVWVKLGEHDGNDFHSSRTQITYDEWAFLVYFFCSIFREMAQLSMAILQHGNIAGLQEYLWDLWNAIDIFSSLIFMCVITSLCCQHDSPHTVSSRSNSIFLQSCANPWQKLLSSHTEEIVNMRLA